MYADAARAVVLVSAALRDAEVAADRMRALAGANWVTATELADTLVRDHGLAFSQAHAVAAGLVGKRLDRPDCPLALLLDDVCVEVIGRPLGLDDASLARVLSPEYFVELRRTHGGPAPEVTAAAVIASRALLDRDAQQLNHLTSALTAADSNRRRAVEAL
jgi:argininosuccinate lyase